MSKGDTMKRFIKPAILTSVLVISALGISGCETTPEPDTRLVSAREAVAAAESNGDVTKYAPTELDRARKLLANAEGSLKEKGSKDPTAAHYAYLASQMAHIAEQRAHEQVATARVKSGETERQKILLSARENEANQAVSQARAAQSAAEQARNEALNAQSEMAAAQLESQRLAAELQDVKTKQTTRGLVLTLDDVLFDTGRSELKSGSRRTLDQIAQFLNEYPERKVQIEGFTDSQGGNDFNLELSQKRADSVASAIIQRGIAADRVRSMGYGEEFPVASNENSGSRQLNRRVEIIVGNGDAPIPGRSGSNTP